MVVLNSSLMRASDVNFENDPDFVEDCRICYSSPEDYNRQFSKMSQVSEILSVFTRLPCSLEIMVGASEGKVVSEGEIRPLTEKTFLLARNIYPSLHFLAWKFGRLHPNSRFIFLLTQSTNFEYLEA